MSYLLRMLFLLLWPPIQLVSTGKRRSLVRPSTSTMVNNGQHCSSNSVLSTNPSIACQEQWFPAAWTSSMLCQLEAWCQSDLDGLAWKYNNEIAEEYDHNTFPLGWQATEFVHHIHSLMRPVEPQCLTQSLHSGRYVRWDASWKLKSKIWYYCEYF